MTTDLLGNEITTQEARLLELLDGLVDLSQEAELQPNTRVAVLSAIAPLAVAATGLGLRFEHLTDYGV